MSFDMKLKSKYQFKEWSIENLAFIKLRGEILI